MLNFQIPDQAGVAHTVVQITMALTDAGNHPQATGSGALRDFVAPELAASVTRTALSAGETTTLQWRATGTGSIAVIINPIDGVNLPTRGPQPRSRRAPAIRCSTLSTHNISGEAHVQVPVTVGPPPRTPWSCGTWSGASTETWTDSAGTPGSWSGGVTLSGFQSGERVTGYFVRDLQLHGLLVRPLDARAGRSNGSLRRDGAGVGRGLPQRIGAALRLPDRAGGAADTRRLAAAAAPSRRSARPEPGREVTLRGQFDAGKDGTYPMAFDRP